MAIRYTKEVHTFIAENVSGITAKVLAEMVNEKFNTEFTPEKMKSYKSNYNLKSGTKCGSPKGTSVVYQKVVQQFIEQNISGTHLNDLADKVNGKFGTNYTYQQIRAYAKNHDLHNRIDCRIKPGNVPPNKGRKGEHAPGCEKGWFQKGETSYNKMLVGTELVRPSSGYVWIKVSEPNKWRMKQIVVWENCHGKIPEGYKVIFLDGDKRNVDIENLALVTNDINLEMNRSRLRTAVKEYTEAGITVAKLKRAVYARRMNR